MELALFCDPFSRSSSSGGFPIPASSPHTVRPPGAGSGSPLARRAPTSLPAAGRAEMIPFCPLPAGPRRAVPARPAALAAPAITGARHLRGGRRRAREVAGGQRRAARCCRGGGTANCSSPSSTALAPQAAPPQRADARGAPPVPPCPTSPTRCGFFRSVAARSGTAGSCGRLCCWLPLLFLGIKGISAANRVEQGADCGAAEWQVPAAAARPSPERGGESKVTLSTAARGDRRPHPHSHCSSHPHPHPSSHPRPQTSTPHSPSRACQCPHNPWGDRD